MAYKTIVVHLADDPEHMARLRLAVGLAKRFDAHLNVVYATEQVDVPAPAIGQAASMAFLDAASETARQHLEKNAIETKELSRGHFRRAQRPAVLEGGTTCIHYCQCW